MNFLFFLVKYVYWGEDLVPLPAYRVESQRPHLQPRRQHKHDAGNIAATANALRVYAARGEVMTPAIVRWLHSQRSHDGGWMSTQVSMKRNRRPLSLIDVTPIIFGCLRA